MIRQYRIKQALELAEVYSQYDIEFIPIPVTCDDDRKELLDMLANRTYAIEAARGTGK